MASKKRGSKKSVKKSLNIQDKINLALKNFTLFLTLFILSFILYFFSTSSLLVNFFAIISIILGFLSVAFLIILLVLYLAKKRN